MEQRLIHISTLLPHWQSPQEDQEGQDHRDPSGTTVDNPTLVRRPQPPQALPQENIHPSRGRDPLVAREASPNLPHGRQDDTARYPYMREIWVQLIGVSTDTWNITSLQGGQYSPHLRGGG